MKHIERYHIRFGLDRSTENETPSCMNILTALLARRFSQTSFHENEINRTYLAVMVRRTFKKAEECNT